MFQIATSPEHGLNTNLLVLLLSESFIRKRKKTFAKFPACIQEDLDFYFHNYKDFKGEFKEKLLYYPTKNTHVQRVLFVGLGDEAELDAQKWRDIGYLIQGEQEQLNSKRNHIFLGNLNGPTQQIIENLTEGIYFKQYRFEKFKSKKSESNNNHKARYIYVCGKDTYSPKYRQGFLKTRRIMQSVFLMRDLANLPSNEATPELIKNFVVKHFKKYANCELQIFNREALQKMGMNGVLSVARGSDCEPYFITIHYKPNGEGKKRVAFVGKGVTFDSGGISIKPSANMEEMKYDMSGAAAVIGIMDYVANVRPKAEVIGVLPLVENMPSGHAIKPGDVIKMYSGKTVEVINTDAEGRLILADALAYTVDKFSPGLVIDFATLTGACMVALGDKRAGLFSNSTEVRDLLFEVGEYSGDMLWPMPLDKIYGKDLESNIADLKNIGNRWGGAITAAKFLEAFVEQTPWAHIDMAGTANDIKHVDYLGKGSTGFGVRLIANALRRLIRLA